MGQEAGQGPEVGPRAKQEADLERPGRETVREMEEFPGPGVHQIV